MSDRFSSPGVLRRFASEIVRKNGKYTSKDIRRFIFAGERMDYDRSLPSGAAMHRIMNALYTLERYTRPNSGANRYEADNISELHFQALRLVKMANVKAAKSRSSVSVLGNAILGMLRKARSRGLTVRDVERVMDRTTYIYEMYTLNGEPEPPALRTIYNILPALHRALQKQDAHAASRAMMVLETQARYLTRMR